MGMELEFHGHGTQVSCLWDSSFMPMELKFPRYGIWVSLKGKLFGMIE